MKPERMGLGWEGELEVSKFGAERDLENGAQ